MGCWIVALDPSPKFHSQAVGFPVDVSVNDAIKGGCPLTGAAVKDAVTGTGAGVGVGVGAAEVAVM